MKEISLKRPIEKSSKEIATSVPKDSYPSFNIYEKAPEELMKLDMGTELTAKIKMSSKETHEGSNTRKSVGFDVLSVMVNEKPVKKLQKQGSQEYME